MKLKLQFLLFTFIVILFFVAPETTAHDFTVKSYRHEDGLPSLRINDGLQDDIGLLWFASDKGIFTYDGYEWEVKYSSEKADEPRRRKILKDEKGKIWALPINWQDSIIYYDGEMWEGLPPIGELTDQFVNQITLDVKYNDDQFEVFVGTQESGIFLFKNGRWLSLSLQVSTALTKINHIKFFKEKLYIASETGFYVYDTGEEKLNFTKLVSKNILQFCFDESAQSGIEYPKIWLLGDNWLGCLQNEELIILSDKIDFISFEVNKIIHDNDYLYIATKQHLSLVNKLSGKQSFIDKDKFYASDGANSVFVDFEKNIWISNNRGIHKVRKSFFNNFDDSDGLLEKEVTAIEFFDDGTMLLGHNSGLSLIDKGNVKTFNFMDNLSIKESHTRVLSVDHKTNGNILFTSQSYGLGTIDSNGKIGWYRLPDENYNYFSVHRDAQNRIWVSCQFDLYELANGYLEKSNLIGEEFFDEKDWIRIINSTRNGSLLLGTSSYGIIKIEEGNRKIIRSEFSNGNEIFSIYENRDGDILVGTLDGLYIVEGDKLVKFGKRDFQIDQPVFFIQPDSDDNLWFGLDNGVIKWDGESYYKYTTNDGLAGPETNRAAGKVDGEGNFWIGTNNGLSRYSDNDLENYAKPRLEFLSIESENDERYQLNSDIKFKSRVNSLNIHFKGISFIDEKQNTNKIRLVNIDNNEEKVFYSTSNEIIIDDFETGKFLIFLSTQNANGLWSDEVKSSIISNPKISYSSLFLYSSIGIAIMVTFLSIMRIRKRLLINEINNDAIAEDENDKYDNPKVVKLKTLLEDEKIYLNPDLSLSNLATSLNTNKTNLSKLINSNYGQNFNNLINSYRVKEAKKMLADPEYHNYTIEAIAEMTGFKSKSAFHKAFKEFSDQTPYQFKKQKINS